jgi:hypothetical protein
MERYHSSFLISFIYRLFTLLVHQQLIFLIIITHILVIMNYTVASVFLSPSYYVLVMAICDHSHGLLVITFEAHKGLQSWAIIFPLLLLFSFTFLGTLFLFIFRVPYNWHYMMLETLWPLWNRGSNSFGITPVVLGVSFKMRCNSSMSYERTQITRTWLTQFLFLFQTVTISVQLEEPAAFHKVSDLSPNILVGTGAPGFIWRKGGGGSGEGTTRKLAYKLTFKTITTTFIYFISVQGRGINSHTFNF